MKQVNLKNRVVDNNGAKLLALMLAFICLAGTARAAFVEYCVEGTGVGFNSFNITWDTTTQLTPAGGFKLTKVSGSSSMPSSFFTVCVDIGSSLTLFRSYGYSDPAPFDGQTGLNPKWGAGNKAGLVNAGNAAAAIQAAADIFYKHSSVLSGSSIVEQSALQLAVWEALYDTTAGSTAYDLTGGGRFSVEAGVPPNNPNGGDSIALASLWLSQVDPNARYSGSLLQPDPQVQYDALVQQVFYNVTPVPEPTTVIAGALLLLPFSLSAIRYLRKQPVRKV